MEIIDIHSNCPNCGAPIELDTEAQAFVCKYCSSIIAVVSESSNSTEKSQQSSPILRKVEPELKYQANHQISALNSQGGHLWITKEEVVFKPHSLNVGPMGKRYIRIQDIVGYKKGALTHMSIFTKSGYEMDIVVWKKMKSSMKLKRDVSISSKAKDFQFLHYNMEVNSAIHATYPKEQCQQNK